MNYEWDIETVDLSTGNLHSTEVEIIDHHFSDYFPGLPMAPDQRLVLVRDSDRDFKGWAYVVDGKLPEFFLDAHGCEVAKVPKRFHKRLARNARLTSKN